jgi:hypothetical protein
MEDVSPSQNMQKDPYVTFVGTNDVLLEVRNRKEGLPLESHSYNKSHPSPKAYCFPKIDDRKSFLIVQILAGLF